MARQIRRTQRGLTLVELLVALVVSLVLMTGVVQIFIANKVTYRTQEGLARIQENGRYAMQRIGRSARAAGYFGCAGLEIATPNVLASSPPADLATITTDTPIAGLNDVAAGNPFNAAPGTDVLTLRGAGLDGLGLAGAETAINASIQLTGGNLAVGAGDFVLFTDCRTADIIRASTGSSATTVVHAAGDNASASLSKPYSADAIALRPFVHSYFVRDTGRENAAGGDIFGFFVRDLAGDHELVEGIADLQLLYGIDQDDDQAADIYMSANAVNGANRWGDVVSVRVNLLVDSIENAMLDPADYVFTPDGNAPVTPDPGDLRLRQEFAGLFTLRNRTL